VTDYGVPADLRSNWPVKVTVLYLSGPVRDWKQWKGTRGVEQVNPAWAIVMKLGFDFYPMVIGPFHETVTKPKSSAFLAYGRNAPETSPARY
jgi:hypothetical protein